MFFLMIRGAINIPLPRSGRQTPLSKTRRVDFEQMSTPQKTRDGKATAYGLGWYIDGVGNRKGLVWHGGVQAGVTSMLFILPKERFGLVILTNLEGGGRLGLETLLNQISDIVRQ